MHKPLVLLLTKNARPGHVKMRLAANIGEQEACRVYQSLLKRAWQVTSGLQAPKIIFYDLYIDDRDHWDNYIYVKALQQGDSLAERLQNAFHMGFQRGYSPIVVVGTDCPALTKDHIYHALQLLETHDYVLGATEAGGYYLLGMRQPTPQLFDRTFWEANSVLASTQSAIAAAGGTLFQLPTLRDVSTLEDLDWYRHHPARAEYLPGY